MEEYIEFFLLSVLTLKLRRLKEPLFDWLWRLRVIDNDIELNLFVLLFSSFVLPTIDQGYAAVSASSAGELVSVDWL